MPVDGSLKSRREVTGRAIGTAGITEGVFIENDDMLEEALPGGAGKMTKELFPIPELATDNIDTEIALM